MCLQSAPPLKYLLLLSDAALVDEGFATYSVRGEGSSSKVEELVAHFIVTCDDDCYVTAGKSVMHVE